MNTNTTPYRQAARPRFGYEIPNDDTWKWWRDHWYLPTVPEITVRPVRIGTVTLWHT